MSLTGKFRVPYYVVIPGFQKWPIFLTTIGYRLHDFEIFRLQLRYKLHDVATL